MINVALCFSDSDGLYYRKAATTMLSVLANTKSDVTMHIVHDETLSLDRQAEMKQIADNYGQTINFHPGPELSDTVVAGVPESFGRGALYRLFLHKMVSADKIIYLDCDIICELDIKELYDHDLGSLPLGAGRDFLLNTNYIKSLGLDPLNYFNSGVLLLNLQWFREHGDEILEMMYRQLANNTRLELPDQDILNLFFNNPGQQILRLDEKFNYLIGFGGRQMQDFTAYEGKIIHMTGIKPWTQFSHSALFYWKYYSKTPWGANAFEDLLKSQNHKLSFWYRFIFMISHKERGWIRRWYDYKTLGINGLLKKRILQKKHEA